MVSGINEEKISELKIQLLDYIEYLNSISNRLNANVESIKNNIDGVGKDEILGKANFIREQLPKISANINSYIDDIEKAMSSYERQDEEIAATLISNISRLEERSE